MKVIVLLVYLGSNDPKVKVASNCISNCVFF